MLLRSLNYNFNNNVRIIVVSSSSAAESRGLSESAEHRQAGAAGHGEHLL